MQVGTAARTASGRFERFALVLMVNHACNLRCTYCYTGTKSERPMPEAVALGSLRRALASLAPGGTLELGFFGGEPLLEAGLIARVLRRARAEARAAGAAVSATLTTNGTITTRAAEDLLADPDLDVAVSHDGLPEAHDRHRVSADGQGSSVAVLATLRRLREQGREPRVVTVVRPSTLDLLPAGLAYLASQEVAGVDLSLDLWTAWTPEDGARLDAAMAGCGEVWRERFPAFHVSPFEGKLGVAAGLPAADTARCAYGHGQVAVAPSGRLYPCERLIGDDPAEHPLRLPGHALDGRDFLGGPRQVSGEPEAEACGGCSGRSLCEAGCACSNQVRTGDPRRPDGLICLMEKLAMREALRLGSSLASPARRSLHVRA